MRITVDLAKASTEPVDLTGVLNPRVGDGDLKLPFHLMYNGDDYDMRGKGMDFLSEGADQKKIHVSGTVDESTKGDDPYTGNVTFTFPTGTFKTPGAYDVDKTMFRVINNDDHSVISTVNVKMNILPNDSDVQSSDDVSYDSRMEKIMKDYSDKGQASLDDAKQKAQQIIDDANKQATDYLNGVKKQGEDLLNEIKQINSEAKGNVAGDTAATATQAKQLANDNSGKIHDLKGEVGDARGRFMTLSDRENKQDFNIDRKEDKSNANANYAAQDLRNDQQDKEIAKKANQGFITDYLSRMYLQPEGFENEAALKVKYPNGKPGIMVTVDTGHKWIWANNQWNDCGIYQAAGIADDSIISEMVRNINYSKIYDDLAEHSKVRLWNAQSEVKIDGTVFELTAKGDNAGAIIPFDTPTSKTTLYLNYKFEVLDGTGLTNGFDVYAMTDGNVGHLLRSVPLTTIGYSKVEIPADYDNDKSEVLVSIHGNGKVRVTLSVNHSGEVRNLEQLSTEVGALSKINDDKYVNIFTGGLVPFQNAKVTKLSTGYKIELDGTNSGAATDWFATDKKQVLVHVAGAKGFKTINIVLAHMDAAGSIHYTTLASSQDGRYDIAVKFKTEDYNAAKYRLIVQSSDENAGGETTINKLEIIPLDSLQTAANYDTNLREMLKKMLIAEGNMNRIDAIYDDDYTNLWNGEFTKFGVKLQVTRIGSEYIINTFDANDGVISPQYQSSSAKTLVHVEGSFTTRSVDVQVAYQTPNGQKYMKLGHVEGGTLNNDFYYDAVNLAVYQNASAFRTLIQCNDDNAKGTINITSLGEYELSSFQGNPMYNRSMQKMMMNIINKIDSIAGTVNTMQADKGLYLTNAQGQKFQLVLNADGTVSAKSLSLNKVLFLGNSLLLGLDTNNESGGPFGMCASDSKHDYAHYVKEGIQAKNSNATFAKLHDAPFEQAATDEAAQNYITDNNDKFMNQDLVIIQIGDNVNQNNLARFKQYLPKLVQQIKSDSPNATIMLVGVWFDHDGLADYLKQLAQDQGCLYVAISALYNSENRASVGDTITFNNGSTMTVPAKYASHPGDNGHKAIADAILSQLNL